MMNFIRCLSWVASQKPVELLLTAGLILALVACGGDQYYENNYYSADAGDDMAYGGFSGRGSFEQVKLGALVTVSNRELAAGQAATSPQTILDQNLNDFPEMREKVLEPGAWVLTFKAEIIQPALVPGLNPLIAQIRAGAGGVNSLFEVSISPGSVFQVSADRVRADIIAEDLINTGAPGAGVPIEQRVTAFLRRATVVTVPVRSFYASGAVALSVITRPVPQLAVDVFAHGDLGGGLYAADTILRIRGGGFTLATYTGLELRAAQLSGSALPVPTGSDNWTLTAGAAGIISPFTIEFGLDL